MNETFGYHEAVTEVDANAIYVAVSDVKDHLGLDTTTHDSDILRYIKSMQREVERYFSVSLTAKEVSVSWLEFSGSIILPYCPIDGNITVKRIDANGVVDTNVTINRVGDSVYVKGEYPEGVHIEYTTKSLSRDDIKARFIQAVGDCLELEASISEAFIKNFRNARI